VTLGSIVYGLTGALTGDTWAFGSGQPTLTESETLSQSGKVLQDQQTYLGSGPSKSFYSYDAASRLSAANIPSNQLSYNYASSAGCGANAAAGNDGNRTSYTDIYNSGTPTTVTYCYDNADRLTSDTIANVPTGASPLLQTPLVSTAGTGQNLTYDTRGNITSLIDQAMTYDQENRHTQTTDTVAGVVTTVGYSRDAGGNAIQMTTQVGTGTATTARYTSGGGIQFVMDTSSAIADEDLTLPGGVAVSVQGSGTFTGATQAWSYPNLHGDVAVTTNAAGVIAKQLQYDPSGDPMDSAGHIGHSDRKQPRSRQHHTPGAGYGWEGSHLKQYQHNGDIATIEMGARQYLPLLGRFLSVDPVVGGNANDYNYPNDPVNGSDLTGRMGVLGASGIIMALRAGKPIPAIHGSQRSVACGAPSKAWNAKAAAQATAVNVGIGLDAASGLLGMASIGSLAIPIIGEGMSPILASFSDVAGIGGSIGDCIGADSHATTCSESWTLTAASIGSDGIARVASKRGLGFVSQLPSLLFGGWSTMKWIRSFGPNPEDQQY
jgi:RHS repeat-associated protein